jgi:hypothetical protein
MDWEDVAFLIGQTVGELLAKTGEGVVEHVTIGSQLLGKAHHARVGIKFGDTVAGVRLREPPRDRHRMRVPGWHRRLRNGAGGDIEANQKCENALHNLTFAPPPQSTPSMPSNAATGALATRPHLRGGQQCRQSRDEIVDEVVPDEQEQERLIASVSPLSESLLLA